MKLTECVACGSSDLTKYLDLGEQPLANTYPTTKEEGLLLPKYELAVNYCNSCYHSQLTESVDPDLLFKDYLYVSGTSKTLRDYFDWFADEVRKYLPYGQFVLDIASNDGTQLKSFKDRGWSVFGVDPAENLKHQQLENGVETITGYWPNVLNDHDFALFDAIICQNVVAHVPNPLEFLKSCTNVLDDNGLLFIQTSQSNMFVNGEFDTIYHEHISFFNTTSMRELGKRAGLVLVDVFKVPVHGTSYVFVFQNKLDIEDNYRNIRQNPLHFNHYVLDQIDSEQKHCIYHPKTYSWFAHNAENITKQLKDTVQKYKDEGYMVVGYGAAAKGNTLLNYGDIHLDYIVDDNELKCGRFTPGTLIPIVSIAELREWDKPVVFVILAWNFFDEIVSKIKEVRNGDKFLTYFPKLKVVE